MTAAFYIAALIALVATVMVITRLNAVHALLYLVVSLLAVALCFYTLGAPFVAALEVIIYAGAIMVLFVFVVMILNLGPEQAVQERRWLTPGNWGGPLLLAGAQPFQRQEINLRMQRRRQGVLDARLVEQAETRGGRHVKQQVQIGILTRFVAGRGAEEIKRRNPLTAQVGFEAS